MRKKRGPPPPDGETVFWRQLGILKDKIETESIDLCYFDPGLGHLRGLEAGGAGVAWRGSAGGAGCGRGPCEGPAGCHARALDTWWISRPVSSPSS